VDKSRILGDDNFAYGVISGSAAFGG
jgi:hypothetical protein